MLGLTGDVDVEQVIQAQRKGLLRRIGLLTALKEQLDPELDLTAMLQVDLSIAKTDAVIRWLDTAEAKILKAAASTPRGVAGGQRRAQPGSLESELEPDAVEAEER